VSDEELRELERRYVSGVLSIEDFDKACRRYGRIGPTIANACHLLSRLSNIAITASLNLAQNFQPQVYHPFLDQLGNFDYSTTISEFDETDSHFLNQILNMIYELARDSENDITEIDRYLPPLLALYLFNNIDQYPRKTLDGIDGVVLRVDTPEEFADLIVSSSSSSDFGREFKHTTERLEEWHVDTWGSDYDSDKYEEVAKLLPPSVYKQLEEDWKKHLRFFPRFGDFIDNQYKYWFSGAINAGYEAYVLDEMYREHKEAINSFQWESGAISMVDEELSRMGESFIGVIVVWISIDILQINIKESILQGWGDPFEDALESLARTYHFSEHYYGEVQETIKDVLIGNIPDEIEY